MIGLCLIAGIIWGNICNEYFEGVSYFAATIFGSLIIAYVLSYIEFLMSL